LKPSLLKEITGVAAREKTDRDENLDKMNRKSAHFKQQKKQPPPVARKKKSSQVVGSQKSDLQLETLDD
jgi:hypothetical protein